MRVPIPVVLLLVLIVVGGTWWINTRQMDFTTPPTEDRLKEVRISVESSFPQTDRPADAISPPVKVSKPAAPIIVEPPFDLGDLKSKPLLTSYSDRAPKGTAHLIELATRLEKEGEFQRALLAWERVLDHTKPTPDQSLAATAAISRLRPTLPDWNADPANATVIVLQAGTGPTLAKSLTLALDGAARELEHASAGILKVNTKVTAGKVRSPATGPKPVALWLTGPEKNSPSTEVLSFTADSPETLREQALKTIFILVRSQISRSGSLTPPAEWVEGENPQTLLHSKITRLGWSEFGKTLTPPLKTSE